MEKNIIPLQAVENPILSSPYEKPEKHWQYEKDTGLARKIDGRRAAGYWYKTKATGSAETQADLFTEEQRDDLPLVNMLRADVERWRATDYRGAAKITRDLLRYWREKDRFTRLFFCQQEAAETLIYLMEIRIPGSTSKTGLRKFDLSDANLQKLLKGEKPGFRLLSEEFFPTLADRPADSDLLPLRRMGCKMATGSGKTIVMAMMIGWAFCNRFNGKNSAFPGAVLICCPNLTVKERLQVLRPDHHNSYYRQFDLIPQKYAKTWLQGRVMVTNWHTLAPRSPHREGDKTYKVVNKGQQPHKEFAREILKDLYPHMPVMVFNDEGHHCYRCAPAKETLNAEEKAESEKATVWIEGLDRINNAMPQGKPGISMTIDFSATPFYIKGSGHPEGTPFPWLVSDFGLVDAIESGIVKIPHLPVMDTTGRPDPAYFNLWKNINTRLKSSDFQPGSVKKPKPEKLYREAEPALQQIAGEWAEEFERYCQSADYQEKIPPVMIVVCDNTDTAEVFFQQISGERTEETVTEEDLNGLVRGRKTRAKKSETVTVYGKGSVSPQYLSNTETGRHTIRIDSRLLEEAEGLEPGTSKRQMAEELRRIVNTVGKPGEPGEYVRCVVSVGMLTEGWDASNVTHILGLRAFDSQLLCEQVVGRGLRRRRYDPDPETGLLPEEKVTVYGIPFTVIPYKKGKGPGPGTKPQKKYHVHAMPERKIFEIRFPNVEGYTFALKNNLICCNLEETEGIQLEPGKEPVATFLIPTVGYREGNARASIGQFGYEKQTREQYYREVHPQQIRFEIARMICDRLVGENPDKSDRKFRVLRLQSRHQLFPQVYRIVNQYMNQKIDWQGCHACEVGLSKYTQMIVERLSEAISPDETKDEPRIMPVINRFKKHGTTADVDFLTSKKPFPALKSHISHVVADTQRWEQTAAFLLEDCDLVQCYAKNDRMGFVIPYEFSGVSFAYEPDYLVKLTSGITVILEIKGYEDNQTKAKHQAAKKWIAAVNNWKPAEQWKFHVCRNPQTLKQELAEICKNQQNVAVSE